MEHIKTVDEFKKLIDENEFVVVDFFATWCGPCKMLTPVIEQVASENPQIKFVKIDVDEAEELAGLFQVSSIPTVAYIRNKQGVLRELGFQTKDHLDKNLKEVFN